MQWRGWLASAAAMGLQIACVMPSRVRDVAVSRAPTRVIAADVLPNPGVEVVAMHEQGLDVLSFERFSQAAIPITISIPQKPHDVVQLGVGRLAVVHATAQRPTLLTRNGSRWTVQSWTGGQAHASARLFTGDLDGDGQAELGRLPPAPTGPTQGALSLVVDSFAGWTTPLALTPTIQGPASGTAVDIDLDGDDDIVCALPTGAPDMAVPDHLRVFRTGVGGILDETWYPVPSAREVASGDFDANGTPELVAFGPSGIWILTNLGRGWFSPARQLSRRPAKTGTVADIDSDGHLDIVALGDGVIDLWRGKDAAQFKARAEVRVTRNAVDLAVVPRAGASPWLVTANPRTSSVTLVQLSDGGERRSGR